LHHNVNTEREKPHASHHAQPAVYSTAKNIPSLRIVIDSPSHFMDEATLGRNIVFTFI